MDLELRGKIALVTGGSHGIGLATARRLAEEGCDVAICARNEVRLNQAAENLRSRGGRVLAVAADALLTSEIEEVMKAVIGAWGTIHILVNNVGGGGRWGSSVVEETGHQVWLDVFNKNCGAAIHFTMLAIPHMRKQKWGRVVTITSIQGREGGSRPWYSVAKTAETSLMKNLALNPELARDGITFNSVAPGSILIPDTGWDQQRQNDPVEFQEMLNEQFPMGRLGTPEEIANVVAFVCSTQASLVTGASIAVDGGESRSF
jgi:3-oxoacyl-[acyl-carrier protein] reductase